MVCETQSNVMLRFIKDLDMNIFISVRLNIAESVYSVISLHVKGKIKADR